MSFDAVSPEDARDAHVSEAIAAGAVTLARHLKAGATMWSVAPEWPAHADHVAVEFVHPVVVGKRAFPAVHVAGPAALRLLSRPGDVVVAMASAGHAPTLDLLRRAEAWGLTRIWLGAGDGPLESRAEHVIWLGGTEPEVAARTGDLVLLYHLLWELTQVVFEHPGLLDPGYDEEVCITCSDEGRVAEVLSVDPYGNAEVVVGGEAGSADVSLVEEVAPGDLLLVHGGVALTTLDRAYGSEVGDR